MDAAIVVYLFFLALLGFVCARLLWDYTLSPKSTGSNERIDSEAILLVAEIREVKHQGMNSKDGLVAKRLFSRREMLIDKLCDIVVENAESIRVEPVDNVVVELNESNASKRQSP